MITKLRLKERGKARQVNEEQQNVYFRLRALCMPVIFFYALLRQIKIILIFSKLILYLGNKE